MLRVLALSCLTAACTSTTGDPDQDSAQQPAGDATFALSYPSPETAFRADAAVRACAADADRIYRTGERLAGGHQVVVFQAHATDRDERVASCLRRDVPAAGIRTAEGVQFRLS